MGNCRSRDRAVAPSDFVPMPLLSEPTGAPGQRPTKKLEASAYAVTPLSDACRGGPSGLVGEDGATVPWRYAAPFPTCLAAARVRFVPIRCPNRHDPRRPRSRRESLGRSGTSAPHRAKAVGSSSERRAPCDFGRTSGTPARPTSCGACRRRAAPPLQTSSERTSRSAASRHGVARTAARDNQASEELSTALRN